MKNTAILVINAGSSSLKCSLFACEPTLTTVYHLDITGLGNRPRLIAKDAQGHDLTRQELGNVNHEAALAILLDWVDHRPDDLVLAAVGHRVVHGGVLFTAPIQITPKIIKQLEDLIPLAPLHQPHNLAPIKILSKLKPQLPQVACFDTAFHATQPEIARSFALPRILTGKGIKRYGFHGLSYEYIAHSLPKLLGVMPARVIVAHLGNGASMAALKNGRSVATTMGFTALDGLMMGTRCGNIDPGVLLHFLKEGVSLEELHDLLYHRSGLLGVSGISNDMQELLNSQSPQAAYAIDLFVYRLARELGSLAAALEGLDALVFTAGIGEHAAPIRAKVCQAAVWLGIRLDEQANEQHGPQISTNDSRVSVWVIATNEELMIAQHTHAFLRGSV